MKRLISIIIPCFNETHAFPSLRMALVNLANSITRYDFEFILVDDGSRDETWNSILAFAKDDPRVHGISLSRNFGHQAALTCGYEFASGEAIVSIDADLQDPPDVILNLIAEWEAGAEIVFAVRIKREGETFFKRWTAAIFYRLFNALSETSSPPDSGDFRLMSRRSVEALKALQEKNRYIRGMVGWIGFKTATVRYERKPRVAGETKFSFGRMLSFALDAIISSSSFPLRLTYYFAILATLPFLIYFIYTLIQHYCFGVELLAGWSSLMIAMSVFGFLNLFCLGLIGEYIGRIYEEAKNRPLYLVRERIKKN